MINVKDVCEKGGMKILCEGESLEREITGCYCGDLLSWVMSRAQSGDAWLTVMGNVNAVGVAALADTACVILTENAAFDENALMRAQQNGITVLQTEKNTYETAVFINGMLNS